MDLTTGIIFLFILGGNKFFCFGVIYSAWLLVMLMVIFQVSHQAWMAARCFSILALATLGSLSVADITVSSAY